MLKLLNTNGLVIWSENEIKYREYATERAFRVISEALLKENKAWNFHRIESSCLIDSNLVSSNYTEEDVFIVNDELTLRPETTAVSYSYADHLLSSNKVMPPLCVWQMGKSFRNEKDQVSKNMRLKEFHQLEFQCIYTAETKNDYMEALLESLKSLGKELTSFESRLIPSDRLPSYSEKTMDVEVANGDKWMEIMSVSLRNDFKSDAIIGKSAKEYKVLEIAIGIDRVVYNHFKTQS